MEVPGFLSVSCFSKQDCQICTQRTCLFGVLDDNDRLKGCQSVHSVAMCVPRTAGLIWEKNNNFITLWHK